MSTTHASHEHWVPSCWPAVPHARLYMHRPSRSAWIDVSGQVGPPHSVRAVCKATHRALGHIPAGVGRIGLNLTAVDRIPIELAVLLCHEARLLGRRQLHLEAVLTGSNPTSPGVERILASLPLVRPDDPDHRVLLQTLAAARDPRAH